MTDQWATVADAARDVGLRPHVIRTWIKRGTIPVLRDRLIMVSLADVRRAERHLRRTGPRPGRGNRRTIDDRRTP